MKTECTNLLLLTISAFWSSSRWPLATYMSSRRQKRIPLGGRYREVSLYLGKSKNVYENNPLPSEVFRSTRTPKEIAKSKTVGKAKSFGLVDCRGSSDSTEYGTGVYLFSSCKLLYWFLMDNNSCCHIPLWLGNIYQLFNMLEYTYIVSYPDNYRLIQGLLPANERRRLSLAGHKPRISPELLRVEATPIDD